jgi:hypothetical protein
LAQEGEGKMKQIPSIHYSRLKAVGNITSIIANGDDITVTGKQFDASTGQKLADLTTNWSVLDIQNQIIELQNSLANFNLILTDLGAVR